MNRIIIALAALVGQATAFVPAVAPRPATQLQASKFDAGAKAAASLAASLALAGAVLTPEAAFAATATQAGGVCAAAPDSEVCRQSQQVKAKAAAAPKAAAKPAASKPKAKAPAKKAPAKKKVRSASDPTVSSGRVDDGVLAASPPSERDASPRRCRATTAARWRSTPSPLETPRAPVTGSHIGRAQEEEGRAARCVDRRAASARWRGGWRMQSPTHLPIHHTGAQKEESGQEGQEGPGSRPCTLPSVSATAC